MRLLGVAPLALSLFMRTQATDWYPYRVNNWATKVDGANAVCQNGAEQSPINFNTCGSPISRKAPTITWNKQTVELINKGYTVQLNAKGTPTGGMSFDISGTTKKYTLVQCHFHWPSEHTINGNTEKFEAHCVHTMDKSNPARYGVFGLFYNEGGTTNSFLAEFEDKLVQNDFSKNKRRMEGSNVSFDIYGNPMDAVTKRRLAVQSTKSSYTGPLDFKKLYDGVPLTKFWSYRGSFTTPPCTEAVDFYIFMGKAGLTSAQLTKFKNAIGWKTAGGNYRPPQPVNSRSIHGCTPWYPYNTDKWAGIGPAVLKSNVVCKDGKKQSPIDFSQCNNPNARSPVALTWPEQKVELINNGYTVQISAKGTDPGRMATNGKIYKLVQCHFHYPSEHTINTKTTPFEVHCVHTQDGTAGKYGVLGMFYEVGANKNVALGVFEDQLPGQPTRRLASANSSGWAFDIFGNPLDAKTERRLAGTKVSSWTGPFDFKKLFDLGGKSLTNYWTYEGSFTTPPCTEAVDFTILMDKAMMTQAQLDKFKSAIGWSAAGGNFRPPQPLNSRQVKGCGTLLLNQPWYPYKAINWAKSVTKKDQICLDGKKQSPIDFASCAKPIERTAVVITYPSQAVDLINNGYTVQLTAKGAETGMMTAKGKIYKLVQCHFHWPSEHTINYRIQDFELHCVHTLVKTGTTHYGVLGLFYSVGRSANTALAEFEGQLPAKATTRRLASSPSDWAFDLFGNPIDANTSRPLASRRLATTTSAYKGPFDFKKLYDIGKPITHYWSYEGSFTTPPCTEAVDFHIIMDKAMMTQAQLDKFKTAIGWTAEGGNYRPPQPLNARSVYGCDRPWYPYVTDFWAMQVGKKSNMVCKTGKAQSPIDFAECKQPVDETPIQVTYPKQAVELLNNGYTVQINAKGSIPGQMIAKGKSYTLVQCHWHWPSEHTIGAKTTPFELHCVHTEDGGQRYGVLGLFYTVGKANAGIAEFENQLPQMPTTSRRLASGTSDFAFDLFGNPLDAKTERRLAPSVLSTWKGPYDFKKLFDIGKVLKHFWHYQGSFTTPPCTEAVNFHILMEKGSLSQAQLDKFKQAIGWAAAGGNFRPPQPLNSRAVSGCTSAASAGPPWYPYTADKWAKDVGSKSNPICKDGKAQSPINFDKCDRPRERAPVGIIYPPSQNVELINNGYTVQINPLGVTTSNGVDTGKMSAAGKIYTLVQCHWHWPSEHTINTKTTPFELHCVHTEDGGSRYGVLGLFYRVGETQNVALAAFENQLPARARRLEASSEWAFDIFGNPLNAKTERRLAPGLVKSEWKGPFDFKKLYDLGSQKITHYWSYEGSFTTPPCTEAVDFHIIMDQASMTQAQLDKFKSAIGWTATGGNYRPPQPLNTRMVDGCDSISPWYPYVPLFWAKKVGPKANQICLDGKAQSPIDFAECAQPVDETPIDLTYPKQTVELINNGHTVQINAKGANSTGKMTAKGKKYTLVQCHWHWPSEHTISTKTTPFELHCVHTEDGGQRYGVLGLFYTLSTAPNAALREFEAKLPAAPVTSRRLASGTEWAFDVFGNPLDAKTERRLYGSSYTKSPWTGPFDFKKLFDIGKPLKHFWHYEGSFTTPPCTEAVNFHILMEKGTMTQAQLDLFKTAIGWEYAGGNYRPPQPLNARTISGCTSGTGVSKPWYPYDAAKWSKDVGASSNQVCTDGSAQSPIDFVGCKSPLERTPIAITYPDQTVEMINNGYTVQITAKGADTGRMSAGGKIYTLVQCHFHWPSEHTIDSKTTPFEAHCVHKQEQAAVRYGVLGLFYSVSSTSNPVFETFEDKLPSRPSRRLASSSPAWAFDIFGNPVDSKTKRRLAGASSNVKKSDWTGPMQYQKMFDIGRPLTHYWSYEGSFTTPPCTEAVDFYIIMEQAPMTQSQLDKFKTAIGWKAAGGNYRPPQPLNSRTVLGCTVPQVGGGGGKEEVDAAFQPGFTVVGLLLLASLLHQ